MSWIKHVVQCLVYFQSALYYPCTYYNIDNASLRLLFIGGCLAFMHNHVTLFTEEQVMMLTYFIFLPIPASSSFTIIS